MIDNYDLEKLKKAKELIEQVYNYNFKENDKITNRLETLLKKIDYIIKQDN